MGAPGLIDERLLPESQLQPYLQMEQASYIETDKKNKRLVYQTPAKETILVMRGRGGTLVVRKFAAGCSC